MIEPSACPRRTRRASADTRQLRDRYTILRMRSLALRGRATTNDDVMRFLILRANHIVAKVYAFLPAQLGVK